MPARVHDHPSLLTGTAEDIDKLARRQVRVTKEHNEECKKLLSLMGIPVVTVSCGFYYIRSLKLTLGSRRGRGPVRRARASRKSLRGRLGGHGHAHVQHARLAPSPDLFGSEEDANLRDPPGRRARGSRHDHGPGACLGPARLKVASYLASQPDRLVHRTVHSPRMRLPRTVQGYWTEDCAQAHPGARRLERRRRVCPGQDGRKGRGECGCTRRGRGGGGRFGPRERGRWRRGFE